jgi:Phosphatidylglycerophosphate synthase
MLDGEILMTRLSRNIPNIITAARFILAAAFLMLLNCSTDYRIRILYIMPLTLIFAAICTTDFIDGKIARKLNAVSTLGAFMDVAADLFYIISAFVCLNIKGAVPIWFTLLIIFNFVVFQISSYIIKSYCSGISTTFVFDYFGRISAVLFYIIPGLVIISEGLFKTYWIVDAALFVTTLLVLISFGIRSTNCIKAVNSRYSSI